MTATAIAPASETSTASNVVASASTVLRQHVVLAVTASVGVALGLAGIALDPGRLQLATAAFSALLVHIVLFVIILRLSRGYLVPTLLLIGSLMQLGCILLYPILDYSTVMFGSDMPFDMMDWAYVVTWSQLILPLGALFAVVSFRVALSRIPRVAANVDTTVERPPYMAAFLYATAVMVPLVWIAALTSGVFGYIVRVALIATGFAPFIAGRYADRYVGPARAWMASLAVNMIIALVGGGRLAAFFPIVLFVVGMISRMSGQRRRRASAIALVTAVPSIYVSAKIGELRQTIGRGGVEVFSVDRVVTVITDLVSPPTESGPAVDELVATQGLGRFIVWPNMAAMIFSPEIVPYRGFGDLPEEIGAYSTLSFVAGQSAADAWANAQFGQMVAARYGFLLDANTAVNFGVVADGWSRLGAAGAFLYVVAVTWFLLLLEELTRWVRGFTYIGYLLLVCNVGRAAMQVMTDPMIYLCRMTVLYIGVMLVVIFGVRFARSLFFSKVL